MQFNRSAIFFIVQMILIIGMHNFFNMQIKSFKTWKKQKNKKNKKKPRTLWKPPFS